MIKNLMDLVHISPKNLPENVCDALVSFYLSNKNQVTTRNSSDLPGLGSSSWSELNVSPLLPPELNRLIHNLCLTALKKYNDRLKLDISIPAPERISSLIVKSYARGRTDKFQVHFDSIGPASNRYLAFLWYLNDVEKGGETIFPNIDLKVKPRKGTLLMFPPYWMFQHTGMPAISEDKFIISRYFLF